MFSPRSRKVRCVRWIALALTYSGLLALSLVAAYLLRFDFEVPPTYSAQIVQVLVTTVSAKLLLLVAFRQFGSLLTYFSLPDLFRIVTAMALGGLLPYLARGVFPPAWIPPRGAVLIDFVLSLAALSTLRLSFRIYRERFARGRSFAGRQMRRVAIYGAGDAGAAFVSEIIGKPHLGMRAAFFLDDDRGKHGRTIHGIVVEGDLSALSAPEVRAQADLVVIAMPAAPGRRVQAILRTVTELGLKVEIIPSLAELATGRVHVSKIRPVDVGDLLGRDEAHMQASEIENLLRDRIVLVTGAGGSIGSELCRQIANLNPRRLLLVERCEVLIFLIEQELVKLGYGSLIVALVADIGDERRMRGIFDRFHPDVVFHAAAHKHVPMMEQQPFEALKNNAVGTKLIASLACEYKADRFVLISTDKAINPTNVMGASKRLAELYLQALQKRNGTGTRLMAVRFGNVLGSSGSVIPTFRRQIAEGGPVTVTHPDVTRYFMTIPEAAGLVLQSATLGEGGEIFVLDMGTPVKIVDLARQLIELSGLRPEVDIAIEFTGLRPGEKLFEELNHRTENMVSTCHTKIMRFIGQPADLDEISRRLADLERTGGEMDPDALKLAIRDVVPEYKPYLSAL